MSGLEREQLAAMTVGELRGLCRMPADGVGNPAERRLHAGAPVHATQ